MGGKKTIRMILREAIALFKARYRVLLVTALLVSGIGYLYNTACSALLTALHLDSTSLRAMIGHDTPFVFILTIAALAFSLALENLSGIPSAALLINANHAALLLLKNEKPSLGVIICRFSKSWKRYLGVAAWSLLLQSLWTFLLLVPGIIKMYSYMLAPYLILEYPDMTARQAVAKSMEITKGHKRRLFGLTICLTLPLYAVGVIILILSIGQQPTTYFVVNHIAILIVSVVLVQPITYAGIAIAYLDIKQAAIRRGLLPGDASPYRTAEFAPEAAATQPVRPLDDPE